MRSILNMRKRSAKRQCHSIGVGARLYSLALEGVRVASRVTRGIDWLTTGNE